MVEAMARKLSSRVLVAPVLFGLQLGVGLVAVFGILVGLVLVGDAGEWAPAGVLTLVGWAGLCLAGLVVLEHRKTLGTSGDSPGAWARQAQQLRSSRLEIVNAFEIERRRLERDLHDGAQQHIVASSMKIGEATLLLTSPDTASRVPPQVRDLLNSAQDSIENALAALRSTVTGVHPTVLSDLGLESAVREMASRSPVQTLVRVPHPLPPIPEGVAAAGYFLISEAVTNVAKHAPKAQTTILITADEELHLSIVDNGPGGAVAESGHGLAGMTERLAAFGGTLHLASPDGGPTSVTAQVPLLLAVGEPTTVLETPRRNQETPP